MMRSLYLLLFLNFVLSWLGCDGNKEYLVNQAETPAGSNAARITLKVADGATGTQRETRNTSRIKTFARASRDSVWVLTDFTSNQIFFSKDGGTEWKELRIEGASRFCGMDFVDGENGWVIDLNGKVWRTTDGGVTWSVISRSILGNHNGGSFFEPKRFFFKSHAEGFTVNGESILRTEDGGATWQPIEGFTQPPESIFFLDDQLGWASVYNLSSDTAYKDAKLMIYRTENGGRIWHPVGRLNKNLGDSRTVFVDSLRGWLVAAHSKPHRTEDAGASWTEVPTPKNFQAKDIFWLDADRGWLAGYTADDILSRWPKEGKAALFTTVDGGRSWTPSDLPSNSEPFLDRVVFDDRDRGWLVARTKIFHTEDSGKSWRVVLEIESTK